MNRRSYPREELGTPFADDFVDSDAAARGVNETFENGAVTDYLSFQTAAAEPLSSRNILRSDLMLGWPCTHRDRQEHNNGKRAGGRESRPRQD